MTRCISVAYVCKVRTYPSKSSNEYIYYNLKSFDIEVILYGIPYIQALFSFNPTYNFYRYIFITMQPIETLLKPLKCVDLAKSFNIKNKNPVEEKNIHGLL